MSVWRGYVGPAGHQVHFHTAGNAGPTIVLFHESPQAANVFVPALPALGRELRVWAFDTPGYGQSDPPEAQREIPEYGAMLLEAIDALDIERFAVLGQHTGASIALEVALQAGPERVDRAIFSGLAVFDEATRRDFLSSWAPEIEPDAEGQHLQDLWQRYRELWEEPLELVQLGVTNPLSVLSRYNWAYNAAFRYDPAPGLSRLSVPALLLSAERDMLAHLDDRAAELLDDVSRYRLTGSTGQLGWRVPAEFARVVTQFVRGVKA